MMPPCTKIWYTSEGEAKQAARIMKANDRAGTIKAYHCPFCDRWHLTALSKRGWKKLKRKLSLT